MKLSLLRVGPAFNGLRLTRGGDESEPDPLG
ncbi:hypothetical protein RCH06_000838 [Polaromonas sp. CG_9.5]|nr:hypothetical protein [Polaromonas sp. CG_9.5]